MTLGFTLSLSDSIVITGIDPSMQGAMKYALRGTIGAKMTNLHMRPNSADIAVVLNSVPKFDVPANLLVWRLKSYERKCRKRCFHVDWLAGI